MSPVCTTGTRPEPVTSSYPHTRSRPSLCYARTNLRHYRPSLCSRLPCLRRPMSPLSPPSTKSWQRFTPGACASRTRHRAWSASELLRSRSHARSHSTPGGLFVDAGVLLPSWAATADRAARVGVVCGQGAPYLPLVNPLASAGTLRSRRRRSTFSGLLRRRMRRRGSTSVSVSTFRATRGRTVASQGRSHDVHAVLSVSASSRLLVMNNYIVQATSETQSRRRQHKSG